MQVVVWSKDNCQYCDMAKKLLNSKGVDFVEHNLSTGTWTKEDLLAAAPSARSVPQIFFGDECIGGYHELKERLG
jgi:glutaredoxin 3